MEKRIALREKWASRRNAREEKKRVKTREGRNKRERRKGRGKMRVGRSNKMEE